MAEAYVDLFFTSASFFKKVGRIFVSTKLSMSEGLRVILPCLGYLTVFLNDLGVFYCKYGQIQSKALGYGEEGLYVDIISLEVLTLLDALEIMVLWESK